MKLRRTYRYRLYPTRRQREALDLHLSEACRLYNAALQERREAWAVGQRIGFYRQDAQLKEVRAAGDIGIVNFKVARNVLRRVDWAFAGFFRRVKAGQRPGYPRFKSWRRYDSLTFEDGHGARLLDSGRLRLQGIGEVKVKLHRPIDGRTKTVTIKREAGRWLAAFVVEMDAAALPASDESVGIDVGLSHFATLSDGSVVSNPRFYREGMKRLRVAQRKVARRSKGSARRRKAVRDLARAHAHVRAQRADFHHKESRKIVNRFGHIYVEDLNVAGLARGFLSRSIHDAGWSAFQQKLAYKAADAGREFVKVDPRGTSQTCVCGASVPKGLQDRWHDCPACGLSLPRDHVSALLIEWLGRSLRASRDTSTSLAREASNGVVTSPLEEIKDE